MWQILYALVQVQVLAQSANRFPNAEDFFRVLDDVPLKYSLTLLISPGSSNIEQALWFRNCRNGEPH